MNLFVGKNSFCYTESVVLPFKTAGWQDSVFVTLVLEGKHNLSLCIVPFVPVFVTLVLEGKHNSLSNGNTKYTVFVTLVLEGKHNLVTARPFSPKVFVTLVLEGKHNTRASCRNSL